jgi:hypothetical protein
VVGGFLRGTAASAALAAVWLGAATLAAVLGERDTGWIRLLAILIWVVAIAVPFVSVFLMEESLIWLTATCALLVAAAVTMLTFVGTALYVESFGRDVDGLVAQARCTSNGENCRAMYRVVRASDEHDLGWTRACGAVELRPGDRIRVRTGGHDRFGPLASACVPRDTTGRRYALLAAVPVTLLGAAGFVWVGGAGERARIRSRHRGW